MNVKYKVLYGKGLIYNDLINAKMVAELIFRCYGIVVSIIKIES